MANLSDIVHKFRVWKRLLPRVQPFYGEMSHTGYVAAIVALSDHGFRKFSLTIIQTWRQLHYTNYTQLRIPVPFLPQKYQFQLQNANSNDNFHIVITDQP